MHAAGLPLSADTVFTAATLAVMPLYALMLAQPHQRLVHLALYCTVTLHSVVLAEGLPYYVTTLQVNSSLVLRRFLHANLCFDRASCWR